MDKDKALDIMLASFQEDTRVLGKNVPGMTDEELEQKIQESEQSLLFMLSNAYDKVEEAKGL
jgi:hypothetical protein